MKRSVFEDEGDLEMHYVGADLAFSIHLHLLVRDPGGSDVVKRLAGAGDALLEGILEADGGRSFDLGDACDGHIFLLDPCRGVGTG